MTKDKRNVSVVIANYNGEDLLKKNLSKIIGLSKNPKNFILEIIIVDDGSNDGSAKFIKENFPEIRLIRHKVNRGVAAAFNTGVRSARGELILTISTDMVPEKDLPFHLLPHFMDKKVFAVSFHEKGIGPEKGFWKDGFIQIKNEKELENEQIEFYVKKGDGIYDRRIWLELGGMDEKLFLPFFWEDLDMSFRAWKRGYQILWEPKAMVSHDHWGTMGKFPKKFIDDTGDLHMLFLIWKNVTSRNLIRKHFAAVFQRIVKNPKYLVIVFRALLKLSIVLKSRRKEIKESKISDEAVFSRFA